MVMFDSSWPRTAKDAVLRLSHQITNLQAEIAEARQTIKSQATRITCLEANLAERDGWIAELEAELAKALVVVQVRDDEVRGLFAQLIINRETIHELVAQNAQLQEDVEQLRGMLATADDPAFFDEADTHLVAKIRCLTTELAEARQTIKSQEALIAVLPDDWLPDGVAKQEHWLQGED